ncbi:MAG: TraB/GumN family protein [Ginsengibacter sp.]
MKRRIFFLYFISFTITSCTAQQNNKVFKIAADSNSLLWQVSGNGLSKPSFLFGTFHLLCREDIKFSTQLKSTMQYSDEIYMELDMDDPSILVSGLLYMNMKNGKALKDLYTHEEYKKIEQFFTDSLQMPLFMFQKTKPFFLIALLYPKMMKCQSFSGVEEEIMKLAKEYKKEIRGLETIEFQSSVFDSIPYDLQARELIKSIDSLSEYAKRFDTMMLAYKNQQLNIVEESLNDGEFDMKKYDGLLINRRNANWVKQLKELMKNESVFAAVGAGHLPGENGLINLLKKTGYIVKPLQNW